MKTGVALLACGLAWSGLAYMFSVTRGEVAVGVVSGPLASLIVWALMSRPIMRSRGWLWFGLPLVSIAIGTVSFVYLVQICWWLREQFVQGGIRYTHVYGYWLNPFVYAFYALTAFVWITYPASLATHYALLKVMGREEAEPGATDNPDDAQRI